MTAIHVGAAHTQLALILAKSAILTAMEFSMHAPYAPVWLEAIFLPRVTCAIQMAVRLRTHAINTTQTTMVY